MSNDDLLQVASVSEQGLYKSRWEQYKDERGYTRKRKIVTDELNSGTFWVNWTGEMVNKTVIRRALKRIKEVLPELQEAIYAFEQDEAINEEELVTVPEVEIPMENKAKGVDLNNLTEEQVADCTEMLELYKANPKLAEDKTKEIVARFENGDKKQDIINDEYAAIVALSKSRNKWTVLAPYMNS